MNLGETYYRLEHLWVVISQPDPLTGDVVLVSFTKWLQNKEQTCIIAVGEHPFITLKTVVCYRDAFVCPPNEQVRFAAGAEQREDVSPELLQRIQEGADESDRILGKCRRLVVESCRRQREARRAAEEVERFAG